MQFGHCRDCICHLLNYSIGCFSKKNQNTAFDVFTNFAAASVHCAQWGNLSRAKKYCFKTFFPLSPYLTLSGPLSPLILFSLSSAPHCIVWPTHPPQTENLLSSGVSCAAGQECHCLYPWPQWPQQWRSPQLFQCGSISKNQNWGQN